MIVARNAPRLCVVLTTFAVLTLYAALAYANPFEKFIGTFDSAVDLLIDRLLPGICILVIAGSAVACAAGKKSWLDMLPVFFFAGVGLAAPALVDFLRGA